MNFAPIDWIIVVVYFAASLGIGLAGRKYGHYGLPAVRTPIGFAVSWSRGFADLRAMFRDLKTEKESAGHGGKRSS